jgi:hypothetical protein
VFFPPFLFPFPLFPSSPSYTLLRPFPFFSNSIRFPVNGDPGYNLRKFFWNRVLPSLAHGGRHTAFWAGHGPPKNCLWVGHNAFGPPKKCRCKMKYSYCFQCLRNFFCQLPFGFHCPFDCEYLTSWLWCHNVENSIRCDYVILIASAFYLFYLVLKNKN